MKKSDLTNLGLRQNCYRLDSVSSGFYCSSSPVIQDVYQEVDSQVVDNGIKEVIVDKPYPHTAAAINSYLDITDYRLDPQSAILNGHHLPNLGDVSGIQEFSKYSSSELAELRSQLERVSAALAKAEKGNDVSSSVSNEVNNG